MSDPGNIVRLVDAAEIEAEAAAWVARFDADAATEEDRAAFEAWKNRSPHHREAASRLSDLWVDLDVLGQLAPPVAQAAPRRPLARRRNPARRKSSPMAVAMSVAAALAVAIALGFTASGLRNTTSVYETAIGEQRTVNLADGSSVQLNTNSRVEVRFTDHSRDLRLVTGEAFFEVAPNKHKPFSVYVGHEVVRAVGTAFVVRLRDEKMEVMVTKGTVQLASITDPPRVLRLDRARDLPRRTLATVSAPPGGAAQSAILADDTVKPAEVSAAQTVRQLAWRQGMLVFAGEPLSEVVADVSRYTDVQIDIADESLATLKVGGYFKAGEVEPMLDALETGFGIQVERLGARHVRLRAKS